MFVYAHLGQFSFRLAPSLTPAPAPLSSYLVQAYKYVNSQWHNMPEYERAFAESAGASTYYAGLCAQGRSLAPDRVRTSTAFSSTVRNVPVVVRMYRRVRLRYGAWNLERECQK